MRESNARDASRKLIITIMLDIKINKVDLIGCRILTNMVCSVQVGSQMCWTNTQFGCISADFEQTFLLKPQALTYTISIYHNSALTDSFHKMQRDEEGWGNLKLIAKTNQQSFPLKIRYCRKTVFARGNPQFCDKPLIEFELNMSTAALKALKNLMKQRQQQEAYRKREQFQRQQLQKAHVQQLRPPTKLQPVNYLEMQNQDEEAVVFKPTIVEMHTNSEYVIPENSVWRERDQKRRQIIRITQVKKHAATNQNSQDAEIELRSNYPQASDMEAGRVVHKLSPRKSRLSFKTNARSSTYNQVKFMTEFSTFSETIPEVRACTSPEIQTDSQGRDTTNSFNQPIKNGVEKQKLQAVSPKHRKASNRVIKLAPIEIVDEEEDEVDRQEKYRNAPLQQICSKKTLICDMAAIPPQNLQTIAKRSPLNRNRNQSVHLKGRVGGRQQQSRNSIQSQSEVLILNTIIFQNHSRKNATSYPTSILITYGDSSVLTQKITEKAILFTKQFIKLDNNSVRSIYFVVYEEIQGKNIIFGKAEANIDLLREIEQKGIRSVSLPVQLCSVKVGELWISHQFSSTKTQPRKRQLSLQNQMLRRSSRNRRQSKSIIAASALQRLPSIQK